MEAKNSSVLILFMGMCAISVSTLSECNDDDHPQAYTSAQALCAPVFLPPEHMKIRLLPYLLILTGFAAKAQSLRLFNTEGRPVEAAVVTFRSPGSVKQGWVLSDKSGQAIAPAGLALPVVATVSHVSFDEAVDTLRQPGEQHAITLNSRVRQLDDVAVTANLLPSLQRDAVVKVDVIRAESFARRGAISVNDVLSRELNMRVGFDPALGTSLSLQGTGGEHVKIMLDGVPVVGRMNGNIDLSQLNLNAIERMEVVRGPQSVLYGTDALGGVVNLITRKPEAGTRSAGGTLFYESIGNYNADARASWSSVRSDAMLQFGRNFFDGWNPPGTSAQRSFLWNPREQYNANLRLARTINGFRTHLQFAGFSEQVFERAEPLVTPYTAYATDQVYRTQRASLQLGTEKQFSPNSQIQAVVSATRYRYIRNTYRKDLVLLQEQLTSDVDDDDTTAFASEFFRGTWTLSSDDKRRTLLLGADMNHESGEGRRIDGGSRAMTEAGLFASADLQLGSTLLVRPSVRFIYNSLFSAPVVPGVHFKFTANPRLVFRASVSSGYRAPALKEQYLFFVDNGLHNIRGNANLNAEHSLQMQAGADWRLTFRRSVFSIEPGVYRNAISDRIVLVQSAPNSTLYTYLNLDQFTARGAELRSRWSHDQFSLSYGVSFSGVDAPLNGVSVPEATWFEHTATAEYRWLKHGTTLSAFLKFNGSQPVFTVLNDGSLSRFDNQSFTLLDLSITQPLWKQRLRLTIGGRNLLDVTTINAITTGGFHTGATSGTTSTVATGASFFTQLSLTL